MKYCNSCFHERNFYFSYVVDGNEQSYVFLFLRGCDIYAVNVHDDENNVLPFLPSTDARKHKLDEPNCKFEEYIVKVLHTSSAVLSYKVESYCLVLVCILRPGMYLHI